MTTTNRNRDDAADNGAAEGFQAQASRFSRKLGDSAEQVWLAGLGALGRAQSEGTRLFESLVEEGAQYQREGRRQAEEEAESIRDQIETRFGQAREKATENWQKLGKVFDARVKNVLHKLQLPDREEVDALRAEVDSLKSQLHATQVRARRAGHGGRPRPTSHGDRPTASSPGGGGGGGGE